MITAVAAPVDNPPANSIPDFDFELPTELIAQHPAARREQARLMRVERDNASWAHGLVQDLPEVLRHGDLLVVNDTKVIPARLRATAANGAPVELLLIHRDEHSSPDPQAWLCLGKPRQRLAAGARLRIADELIATVVGKAAPGRYWVRFEADGDLLPLLARHGEIPLPPYIRRPAGPSDEDRERYQTVFARHPGAIAAPTAGLHFTPELLARLATAGIELTALTLHVGPGTFLPIRDGDLGAHRMEAERFEISPACAQAIRSARRDARRVVAVGTTTTRALESAADSAGEITATSGWADLFIVPGHRFQIVDALFTNFHLPASTLLLLVSAFAGTELVRRTYAEAVAQRYRFYSYGDAMLIQ